MRGRREVGEVSLPDSRADGFQELLARWRAMNEKQAAPPHRAAGSQLPRLTEVELVCLATVGRPEL